MNKTKLLDQYKEFLLARNQSLNYFNVIKTFLTFLEKNNIEPIDITQETITQFFTEHSKYASTTKNLFINAGRNFYEFLGFNNSEWHKIKIMRTEFRIPDFLSTKEVTEAKNYLKTYHSQTYSLTKVDALFSFLFATGIRQKELLLLKRVDIDLENSKAKVFGKGKKERYVYFDNKTKKDLETYFQSEEEKINAFNVTIGHLKYMTRLLSKYLGKKVYCHLFRHSSARNMWMKDVPVNMLSKILGHSSIQTTLRYIEPTEQMIAEKYKEKMK